MLTAERLREVLHYDPGTGVFTWRVTKSSTRPIGAVAGTFHRGGGKHGRVYCRIQVDGKLYRSHRLAWLYMTGKWPVAEVDHKDLDGANNRWGNLREATRQQNNANKSINSSNTSGFKGVRWHRAARKWVAEVGFGGKRYYLGLFATAEDASAAYRVAATRIHGEFARTG